MKVLILCAGEPDFLNAFVKTRIKTGVSLVENQISSLLLLGINATDIYVVLDEESIKNQEIASRENKFGINFKFTRNFRFRSANTFINVLNNLDINSDLLILNGDTFFALNDIEALLTINSKLEVLVENRTNRNSEGLRVNLEKRLIERNYGDKRTFELPWVCYSGALKIPKKKLSRIKKSPPNSGSYLELLINDMQSEFTIKFKAETGISKYKAYSKFNLIGGSYAGLKNSSIITKRANKQGSKKLANEINWLLNLDTKQKVHFTEVLDYKIDKNFSQYTMPHYGYNSMRQSLIAGTLSPEKCTEKLSTIFEFLNKEIYSKDHSYNSDWVSHRHFSRFDERLEETLKNKQMAEIFEVKSVSVNGKSYENLRSLVQKIRDDSRLIDTVKPKRNKLVSVHGDLHLQNILIDEFSNDFVLVDPRGELKGADIFYDIGKLWHSVNGLYDFIHTDISKISQEKPASNEFIIEYAPIFLCKRYEEIKSSMYILLDGMLANLEPDWYLKMTFNEAMHFSTLFNFHLKNDGEESRAKILYLTAIRLCTELLNYKDYKND
tara:strand:- start:352 stop:2007 length:1656 start_codon:yes stop_codon:yes gene_type:complete